MKITLNINGKDKDFATPFISGRKLRNTFAMSKKIENLKQDETMLDEMVTYIVDIFGNQFDLNQFYDGIEANKIIPTFTQLVEEIIGTMNNKAEQLAIASKNA